MRLAYGCFLFCGLTSLVTVGLELIAPDRNAAAGLLIMIGAPLILIALVALGIGIVVTIQYPNPALLVLSGASVLFLVEMVGEYGSADFYNAAPAIYGVVAVGISAVSLLNLQSSSDAGPDAQGLNPPALPSPDS